MKHIVKLIVENKGSLTDYVAQLSFVFRDAISILPFCMDDPDAYTPQKEEVVLTSAFSATDFREWKKTHLQGQQLIPINLCLPRRSLLRLNAYPKGTRALLVNVTKFMAEETIAQLYQAGYSHISFVPCYPGYDGPSLPLGSDARGGIPGSRLCDRVSGSRAAPDRYRHHDRAGGKDQVRVHFKYPPVLGIL